MKPNKLAVGQRIKQLRLVKALTLEEFGQIFDCDKSIVYRWESGQTIPSKERLEQIAKYANTSVNQILFGSKIEQIYNINEKLSSISEYLDSDTFDRLYNELDQTIENYNQDLNA